MGWVRGARHWLGRVLDEPVRAVDALGRQLSVVVEQRFRAMGSDGHVIVVGGRSGLVDLAIARLDDLERRWSRFLADSEVSTANRCAGRWTPVSPATVALFERAELARRRTEGCYDPTLLEEVCAAGYDRDFPAVSAARAAPPPTGPCGPPRGPRALGVDRSAGAVLVPAGCGMDPGGIGKGLAADMVAAELLGEAAAGVCVNLGGDVRVAGVGPDGTAWRVEVEDPRDPEAPPVVVLELADGAVATSSRCRRRWGGGAAGPPVAHHLIDPCTGAPADTATLSCTVVAAEGWQAEALAKVAFVRPVGDALAALDEAGATGLVVTGNGVVRAPGLGRFSAPALRRR